MDDTRVFDQFTNPSSDIDHEYMSYHENNLHDDEMMHQQISNSGEIDANAMIMQAYQVIESEESMLDIGIKPKTVHQCPACNKIFVSFKGLQQHAIIHTDQKPFECDICGKSFRFKSNLFEHRSVHTGTTPHQCPICGKTCRLKGNLKKHLRTHCTTREELEIAWQPFASNRRAPSEIPSDAIIIRPNPDASSLFTPPNRPKKKKFGLGTDATLWIEKIRRGDLLPFVPISDRMRRILELVKLTENGAFDMENLFVHARAIPFERYECLLCKAPFLSRIECQEHIDNEHPNARKQRPNYCDICLRSFNDRQQLATHQEHHKRIQMILESGELKIVEPLIMMPVINEGDEKYTSGQCNIDDETAIIMDNGTHNWENQQ